MNPYDDYSYEDWAEDMGYSASQALYDQDLEDLRKKALLNEDLLRWEHELSVSDYPTYFLEEALLAGRKSRTR